MSTDMVPDNPPRLAAMSHLDPAKIKEDFDRIGQTSHLDPAEIKKHFDRIGRFRILVVGRSNAGKTTLLQRVCNTTELPDIYNSKGEKVQYLIMQRHRSLIGMVIRSLILKSYKGHWRRVRRLTVAMDNLTISSRGGNTILRMN